MGRTRRISHSSGHRERIVVPEIPPLPCTPLRQVRRHNSPYRGVTWSAHSNERHGQPWVARVSNKYLGRYATPEEAALAHDEAAKVLYGDDAILNFPDEG